MPAWSEDFVEQYFDGRLELRIHRDRPVVGLLRPNLLVLPRIRSTDSVSVLLISGTLDAAERADLYAVAR